jgi:hypothetical protein
MYMCSTNDIWCTAFDFQHTSIFKGRECLLLMHSTSNYHRYMYILDMYILDAYVLYLEYICLLLSTTICVSNLRVRKLLLLIIAPP